MHDPATDVATMNVRYWRGDGKPLTIRADNGLDQAVTVTVYCNRLKVTAGALAMPGLVLVLAAGIPGILTLVPPVTGWVPNIFVQIQAAFVPTVGTISVYAIGEGVMP